MAGSGRQLLHDERRGLRRAAGLLGHRGRGRLLLGGRGAVVEMPGPMQASAGATRMGVVCTSRMAAAKFRSPCAVQLFC